MNDISLVIQTCDEYEKFWHGWYLMFKRHKMFDLGWPVYFCNEEIDLPFSDIRFTQIKTGKSKKYMGTEQRDWLPTFGGPKQVDEGWSDRLIHILKSVDTKYVFYMQEDQWPFADVDVELFNELLRLTEHNKIDALRMHRLLSLHSVDDWESTNIIHRDKHLLRIKSDAGFIMSHQPTIWNREFLLNTCIPGEGFRDNEYAGSERIKNIYPNHNICLYNHHWFYERSGSNAGEFVEAVKWELDEKFNEENIENHFSLCRPKYQSKKEGHKLSLVTSCYNAERYIEELAESVFSQSYDNWEWTLADDFSDDGTLDKLHKLQNRDSRVKIAYPKHKKEVWWNPQKFASGDIVCHLDADDKLLLNAFEIVNHYFTIFPEVVLMHFNANKYHENFPKDHSEIFSNWKDNVYITRDNDSFLEGFEKLWHGRTNIFGYLRIFRNLPGLDFPVHEDGDACLSNDGQWLLMLEERGKWLSVPRTVYLAREHGNSENFRRWNPRGEAQLVINTKERRKGLVLEYPRNVKYFDDIYDLASSVYTSSLNYQKHPQCISFCNFNQDHFQQKKTKQLFFDHDVNFDYYHIDVEYFIININLSDTAESMQRLLTNIKNSNSEKYELILYSDNFNLHQNNRTNFNNLESIKDVVVANGYGLNWFEQHNNYYIVSLKPVDTKIEFVESSVEKIEDVKIESTDRLKIMQVHIGCGLDIPPKGYGGLEEVMHHYMRVAKMRGHEIGLKWLDDITQADIEYYDVFHNHTGGFHKYLEERCLPYIFTTHDVHPKVHGKESWWYNINNETIKNSIFSLIPCDHMIPFYEHGHKLRKLNHGVDSNFYFPFDRKKDNIRLICVGGGDDRKGFHLAILAARELGLPITIVGPDSIHSDYNEIFYAVLNESKKHIEINQTGNLDKFELRKVLNEHDIIVHPSDIETGQPCLAVLEAMACGLPCAGTMQDKVEIPGLVECTREPVSIVAAIRNIINNYDELSKKAREFGRERDWTNIFDELEPHYYEARERKHEVPTTMKERLVYAYSKQKSKHENKIVITVNQNPHVHITGNVAKDYNVEFFNDDTGELVYSNIISNNCWCACNINYYVKWRIIVTEIDTSEIVEEYVLNLTDKKVYVWFDSAALGDNLAWIGAVNQFQQKHKCKLYCFTFFNHLFRDRYPNIEFVDDHNDFHQTGQAMPAVPKVNHTYWIGFMGDPFSSKIPIDPKKVPLQQVCASILGIDYREERAKIVVNELESELNKPYVCIGIQSTAQAKYWNYPGGWDNVVKYLKKKNYDIVCIDQHRYFGNGDFMNSAPEDVIHRHDRTLDQTIATMNGCEFFIGLGSGLSWLAWALEKPVVLISGFSRPFSEFSIDCERVFNPDVCNGCYNDSQLDPSNWKWCPIHEDTDRMFECTKTITPSVVKESINNIIEKL